VKEEPAMTDAEYDRKLDELDRMLNDPALPMEADAIWTLLDEIAQRSPEPALA
jgi:hypothetical protein